MNVYAHAHAKDAFDDRAVDLLVAAVEAFKAGLEDTDAA